MGEVTKDLFSVLLQLVPGFIAAWVLYGLTSYPKPSQFERVVQALIFSFLIKAVLPLEKDLLIFLGRFFSFGAWDSDSELLAAGLTGIVFGLLCSYCANNDSLYALLRKLRLTKRTAYPSEWYGAFNEQLRFVVLHLKTHRRIIGWVRQWPSAPNTGHFMLMYAAWLTQDGSKIELSQVDSILIAAIDVQMVEFLKSDQEMKNGTKAGESASANTANAGNPG